MKHGLAFLLPLLFILDGCNNSVNHAEIKTAAKDTSISLIVKDTIVDDSDGCTGGRPNKPIVDSIKHPDLRFRYENRVGYNYFVTSNGDSICVEQSSCDYATYIFVVKPKYSFSASEDTGVWISKAADIIEGIRSDVSMMVEMDSGLHYLRKYFVDERTPVGTEIDYNFNKETQWRHVVRVNSAEREKHFRTITIAFYEGPL